MSTGADGLIRLQRIAWLRAAAELAVARRDVVQREREREAVVRGGRRLAGVAAELAQRRLDAAPAWTAGLDASRAAGLLAAAAAAAERSAAAAQRCDQARRIAEQQCSRLAACVAKQAALERWSQRQQRDRASQRAERSETATADARAHRAHPELVRKPDRLSGTFGHLDPSRERFRK